MCLTWVPIYIDPWKSFIKFGIKKSHEMISYMLVGSELKPAFHPMGTSVVQYTMQYVQHILDTCGTP
jgi:hypothetical protein